MARAHAATTVSVVGASGLVGGRLLRTLRAGGALVASGTCWRSAPRTGLTLLDVTDEEALRAHLRGRYDWVVVAAGTKDVARCEADPAHAHALNAAPIEAMVRIVEEEALPTRLLYLSTDYVFDGARGAYRDGESPSPATRYGRAKADGERAALAAGHLVVRSGAVMARRGRFFDWLTGALPAPCEIPLFDDSFFSPTPAQLLCDVVAGLLSAECEPGARVLHVVGDRRMSRLELGRAIAARSPAVRATLVPTHRPAGDPTHPRDLSLVPSEVVGRLARRPWLEYLAAEIDGSAG